MKRMVCCFLVLSAMSKMAAQTMPQEIDELLKAYSTQGSFNGAALVAQKGTILLQKGYGYRNASLNTFNDSSSVFQISSLTKQFTATIILQLQEQHLLSIQDKLSKYLPGFPNGDSITIENLLTNTSGIHNYNDELFMEQYAAKHIALDSLMRLFKNLPLDFSPGIKFGYSNSNYILLGLIIEKLTGKPYFMVVRNRILKPLGMVHSGFDFSSLKSANKTVGYFQLERKTKRPAPVVDSSVTYAAGALYSTVGDLYKWDRALYFDKIVHDSSLEKAFTPYNDHYGYGWLIDTAYGKRAVMHEGGTFGFTSLIVRVPIDSTCIILLDNKQSDGLLKIAESINAILNNQPYDFPIQIPEIEVDSFVLRTYVGTYQLSPKLFLNISLENGHLLVAVPGNAKSMLFAEKENLFFLKMQDIKIEFIRSGTTGQVYKINFWDHGQKLEGLKIK